MENNTERTCVVCKEKNEKKSLFRIAKRGSKFYYDREQRMQSRGAYICKTHDCVKRIAKHKRYNLELTELTKMLDDLKVGSKNYLEILRPMKSSEYLTFGINMVLDELDKIHFIIIAEDISDKNDKKLVARAKEMAIEYVHSGSKAELGEIFGKGEVTVVGVKNKKVARGLKE